jgi:hypothetical protein
MAAAGPSSGHLLIVSKTVAATAAGHGEAKLFILKRQHQTTFAAILLNI